MKKLIALGLFSTMAVSMSSLLFAIEDEENISPPPSPLIDDIPTCGNASINDVSDDEQITASLDASLRVNMLRIYQCCAVDPVLNKIVISQLERFSEILNKFEKLYPDKTLKNFRNKALAKYLNIFLPSGYKKPVGLKMCEAMINHFTYCSDAELLKFLNVIS